MGSWAAFEVGGVPELVQWLAAAPDEQPPMPQPGQGVQYAKIVWAIEEAQRILEGEGLMAESQFISDHYKADAIRLRDGG